MPQGRSKSKHSRRNFLKLGAAVGLTCVPAPVFSHVGAEIHRELRLHHLHTGEKLNIVYWVEGRYLDEPMAEIDRLLRDFRTGEVKPIDRGLLDLLSSARRELDSSEAFEVISGYRSPTTNRMLAEQGKGVARKSLHMAGMAIDVNLQGRSLDRLQRVAISLKRGGVGYYPKSGFVHLDVGRVRTW
jgi:uncharacterized protein YcbK (DUF882 family)